MAFIRRHGAALLLMLAGAGISAVFSWGIGFEYRWTGDTTETFYRIVSTTPGSAERGGSLLGALTDGIVGVVSGQPMTDWYQGVFDAYLRAFHVAWGDIALAYKIQVFPFTLAFGLGAYFLFLFLTGNRWAAAVLTVLAILPMPLSWAGERSGLGPIWSYTRRYFLTACLPFLVLLYYRGALLDRRLLPLAMIMAGLAANLHASGVILIEILALSWLLSGPLTRRRVMQSLALSALALCFSVAAMGSLWTRGLEAISELLVSAASGDSLAAGSGLLREAKEKVPEEMRYLFYPPKIYAGLPDVAVDLWLIATMIVSLAPLMARALRRSEQRHLLFLASGACLLFIDFDRMWLWVLLAAILARAGRAMETHFAYALSCYLVISTFWISVGGMLVFQFCLQLIDGFPVIFNQLRGIRFMGLWVFAWLATLAAPVIRQPMALTGRSKRLLVLVLVVGVIVLSRDVYRQYFRVLESDHRDEKRELLEIATWAKQHTSPGSVFLVNYSPFGIVSERGVAIPDRSKDRIHAERIPPNGIASPSEAMRLAERFQATHLFLPVGSLNAGLQECVLLTGQRYVLAKTYCIRQAFPKENS